MWYLSALVAAVVAHFNIVATTAFGVATATVNTKVPFKVKCTIHRSIYSLSSMSGTKLDMSSSLDIDPTSLTLYGHPGTRSPLINWACYELGFDIKVASDLSRNPHPFGQLPCLTDDNGKVVVFESGAILQYIHEHYSSTLQLTKEQRAAVTSWIVWANASLDPICFLETPNGKVYDTGLRQRNRKIDQLNSILSSQSFLVGTNGDQAIFTLADVAIVSYLAYVLQFFPDVTIADKWPAIATYMQTCISRPTYGQAFGTTTQNRLLANLEKDIATAAAAGGNSPQSKGKKVFGMF